MAANAPKGWERDSDKLYVHETGIRIQRMTYKGKEGWFLVPVDLDQAVIEFEPTPEGKDKAFEAFAKGVLVVKPKRAKAASPKKAAAKAATPPAEDAEEEEKEDDDEEEGEDEKEKDKDKDKEKEEKKEEKIDEGDEG